MTNNPPPQKKNHPIMSLLNKTKKQHIYLAKKLCVCKRMKEKKKKVKATVMDEAQVHMGIFIHQQPHFFPSIFSPFCRENFLVDSGKNGEKTFWQTWGENTRAPLFIFLPPYSTKYIFKKFIFSFSFHSFPSIIFYLKKKTRSKGLKIKCSRHKGLMMPLHRRYLRPQGLKAIVVDPKRITFL